jgi:hypothetical protein
MTRFLFEYALSFDEKTISDSHGAATTDTPIMEKLRYTE